MMAPDVTAKSLSVLLRRPACTLTDFDLLTLVCGRFSLRFFPEPQHIINDKEKQQIPKFRKLKPANIFT